MRCSVAPASHVMCFETVFHVVFMSLFVVRCAPCFLPGRYCITMWTPPSRGVRGAPLSGCHVLCALRPVSMVLMQTVFKREFVVPCAP